MKSSNELPPETMMEFGGLCDDLTVAMKWRPILPLLQTLENSTGTVAKAYAIRNIVAFILKTGLGKQPADVPVFAVFDKAVRTLAADPEWQTIVAGLMGDGNE
jgi:hypothetical protein